jgi:hypothetical protein
MSYRRVSSEAKATKSLVSMMQSTDLKRGLFRLIGDSTMDQTFMQIDASAHHLRRVGRLARRRMRIEGAQIANGIHTDGRLTIEISGLSPASAGAPQAFEWKADRPIALVIVRSGLDGDDVTFQVGPARSGSGLGARVSDGTGIRYIAFCYDAEIETAVAAVPVRYQRSILGQMLERAG